MSAMVDGCTRFQAFRHVIIPVMWPGVITTGLFSFLLAYNDFAVTSMLLTESNRTMVPAIAAFLGTTQTEGDDPTTVTAVAGAGDEAIVLLKNDKVLPLKKADIKKLAVHFRFVIGFGDGDSRSDIAVHKNFLAGLV